MKKSKHKYFVYAIQTVCIEGEPDIVYPKKYAGTTYAVSETQAINNVKYRVAGAISQYLPIQVGGHYETFVEWEAERAERQ